MTIPKWHEVAWPLLQFAATVPEFRLGEAAVAMADHFQLKAEEREQRIPSGQFTYSEDRAGWPHSVLFRAGCLERVQRGLYRIAQQGRDLLTQHSAGLNGREIKRMFGVSRASPKADAGTPNTGGLVEVSGSDLTPEEAIRSAFLSLDAALKDELLTSVLRQEARCFERLVLRTLLAMGYGGGDPSTTQVVGGAGDQAVDVVIHQDPLGLDRVYVQAKCYARDQAIGPSTVHALAGSLGIFKASKGLLVTTSRFTRAARDAAEKVANRVVLVDGDELATLMIRYGVGVRIADTIHIKKVDEDFFLI